MGAKKITNQYMMPDLPEGKIGIICWCCKETTVFKSPLPVEQFSKIGGAFEKLHTAKGCNQIEIQSPNK